jgi:hypothetical protein
MVPGVDGELSSSLKVRFISAVYSSKIVTDRTVETYPVGKGKDSIDI